MRVTNKKAMYRMLSDGVFGNTIRQYFSVADWEASPESSRYAYWGVRTLVPGGPCRLNCPVDEVRETAGRPEFRAAGINISLMLDRVVTVTLWCDVYDSPTGLYVYGIEHPPRGGSWRAEMPSKGREYRGLAAHGVLRRHFSPSSLADLEALRERFPGHVYEFSACDRPVGTIPGRNTICWEVRQY